MNRWVDLNSPLSSGLLRSALDADPQRLDLAALAVAALENPLLDPRRSERILDELGARVCALLDEEGPELPLPRKVELLRQVLAREEGFRGDSHRGGDPAWSALDQVLETRVGLPITLSVVYLEVARRADIPLFGVSFPGHFLVAFDSGLGKRVLDPFFGGEILTESGCQKLLRQVSPQLRFSPRMLVPASVRAITTRMLRNLERNYFEKDDHERALKVMDLLLQLSPNHPGDLRTRASLLSALGAFRAALADVERCLTLSPQAPDCRNLRLAATALRARVETLN